MRVNTSSPSRSETERSFLQRRVALLGLVLSLVGGIGLASSIVEALVSGQLFSLWAAVSAADTALWVALWLSCRSRPRSTAFCRIGEAMCLLGTGIAFGAMARLMAASSAVPDLDPTVWGAVPAGHYWGLHRLLSIQAHQYGLALFCVLRAALVPSRPGRTLVLTLFVGLPLALFVAPSSLPLDPPEIASVSIPGDYGAVGVLNVAMQWAFSVAICTVLSGVIYGLRRELQQARRLGQYTLEAKLGEGGMGIVYRASHAMMRRPTAIKLLSSTAASSEQVARFEREVQETARLTHPNTITIFDYGRTPEGVFYYVMELLDGATAEAVVKSTGPMSPTRVVHVLRGVCGSLEEAHGIGLIHRDIKPANIFLCSQGGRPDVPKVLDFGLVKEVGGEADAGLTVVGTVAGTPLYMAPEMITRPGAVDARADLYAVGAVGYFLLTGKHVFEGATAMEICGHHLHSKPQPPSERLGSSLPPDLEALILDCLRKEPNLRPQSAAALAERLEACDGVRPWTVQNAREWWDEYGHLFAGQPTDGTVPSRTIAVHLGG